jgi:F-type H+-transporting ATPase subunit epsilon
MAARIHVEVVTPEKRLLQVEADEVIAPGALGLFGVRPGHAPFLSLVEPGLLTVNEGGKLHKYFVAGGFVQVSQTNVRVLADNAEAADKIDTALAKKRIAEAEARLNQLSPADEKVAVERETIRREQKRLEVAAKH